MGYFWTPIKPGVNGFRRPRRPDLCMLGPYEERYRGFRVKHFHEQLPKRHHYKLGYTAPRLALQRAGLAQLRQFEHFGGCKYLRSLEPTPEGRHYSGIGGTGPAVIFGGG